MKHNKNQNETFHLSHIYNTNKMIFVSKKPLHLYILDNMNIWLQIENEETNDLHKNCEIFIYLEQVK